MWVCLAQPAYKRSKDLDLFSPSILWVLGIKLGSLDLGASALSAKLSQSGQGMSLSAQFICLIILVTFNKSCSLRGKVV